MPRPAFYNTLLDKSIAAMLAAIEIYNKPTFEYRADTFTILAINAWELLLKAQLLKIKKNDRRCLYAYERTQNGRRKRKKSRSEQPSTLGFFEVIKALEQEKVHIADIIKNNLHCLVQYRDSAIHYINTSAYFEKKVQELGTAAVQNFVEFVKDWFGDRLSKYTFYLMPLYFVRDFDEAKGITSLEENKLLQLIDNYNKHAAGVNTKYALTVSVDIQFKKNSTANDTQAVRSNTGIAIIHTQEEIDKLYPLTYDDVVKYCYKKYVAFKKTKEFHGHMTRLKTNKDLAHIHYLDPAKKTGSRKVKYSPRIHNQLDKIYKS